MNQPQAAVIAPPARRLNLPFLAALAIVIGAYAVAFMILRALVPKEFEQMAGTVAALSLGGGAYVQRQIERRLRIPVGPVPTRAGYQKPWWVLLAASTLVIWVAQSAPTYLQLTIGPDSAILLSISALLAVLLPAAALFVGALVGQRSDRWPLAVTLVAVAVGWAIARWTAPWVIGLATGSPVTPPDIGPPPPFPSSNPGAEILSSELPLLVALGMLGYWYGTRTRLQAYLGGLLRDVQPDDREAIVDMAYEAARVRRAQDQRSSGS